jgi:hypothetical protein
LERGEVGLDALTLVYPSTSTKAADPDLSKHETAYECETYM